LEELEDDSLIKLLLGHMDYERTRLEEMHLEELELAFQSSKASN
jgi:hypothetical protein